MPSVKGRHPVFCRVDRPSGPKGRYGPFGVESGIFPSSKEPNVKRARACGPVLLFGIAASLGGWPVLPCIGADVSADPLQTQAVYGSSPKGVTLEGVAAGFPSIRHVRFDGGGHRFHINDGEAVYFPPIPRNEVATLFNAIARDRRLGVTLRPNKDFFTYGQLDKRSSAAQALATADKILGGTVFATADYLKGVRLPQDFKPAAARRRVVWSAARFNFAEYSFGLFPEAKAYRRVGFRLIPTLTPVIPNAAADGGHKVDEARLRQNILGEPEDIANFNFLLTHLEEFLRIPELMHAANLGEVAAFARYLQQQGQDLVELARGM